jgi:hypothetical protein
VQEDPLFPHSPIFVSLSSGIACTSEFVQTRLQSDVNRTVNRRVARRKGVHKSFR